MARASALTAVVAWASLAAHGCSEAIVVGVRLDAADGGGDPDAGAPPHLHPVLDVGDTPAPSCNPDSRVFRHALCSCTDVVGDDRLRVDAFDSRDGAYRPGLAGGSVGANLLFSVSGAALGGSLRVAGPPGIMASGGLEMGGDLRCGGALEGDTQVDVGGDADVAGRIRVETLQVGGQLTQPADATLSVTSGPAPDRREAPVSVAPPCTCEDGSPMLDLIDTLRDNDDNGAIDLPRDGLDSLMEPVELALPAGRYLVSRLLAREPMTFTVQGRVTFAVEGDISSEPGGSIRFELGPEAELDLVVGGALTLSDALTLGSAASAGRARLYAATTGTLDLAGPTLVAGAFYAPSAEVVSSAGLTVHGAALARRFAFAAPVELHYDRALGRTECLGIACDSAAECGTLACLDGACARCTESSQCADAMRCVDGACLP